MLPRRCLAARKNEPILATGQRKQRVLLPAVRPFSEQASGPRSNSAKQSQPAGHGHFRTKPTQVPRTSPPHRNPAPFVAARQNPCHSKKRTHCGNRPKKTNAL